MKEIVNAILLGIVQGITEFVPVSSSGHLVLLHEWLNFDLANPLAFDVAVHMGTLLAVVIFFWKDLSAYAKGFLDSLLKRSISSTESRLAWFLIAATIPGVIAGVLFDDFIEETLRSPVVVSIMLFLGALLFLVAERYTKRKKKVEQMTLKSSLLVGAAQALALIPGVSRSGITMVTGMQQGLKREEAARFSFLMSVPIIFGAGAKTALDVTTSGGVGSELPIIVAGFASSGIVGYIVIAVFLRYLRKHPLDVFAYYRILLAAIVLIFLT